MPPRYRTVLAREQTDALDALHRAQLDDDAPRRPATLALVLIVAWCAVVLALFAVVLARLSS